MAVNIFKGQMQHTELFGKGDWDFDGFVMSDFVWGVKDTVEAANGGQDMEMMFTTFFAQKLIKAVQK